MTDTRPRPVWLTGAFWIDTVERTVRVFAWSTIAAITAEATDIVNADFRGMAIQVGIATLLAFLGCLAGGAVDTGGKLKSASFFLAAGKPAIVAPAVGEGPVNGPAAGPDNPARL
jgi:hypothetical protein